MLSKSLFTALTAAGILICSTGCSSGHSTNAASSGTHTKVRFLNSSKTISNQSGESAWAKSFMKHVPVDAVGYPSFGLVVAPLSNSSTVPAQASSSALASFKHLRAAQALLGKLLTTQAPSVALRTVTDYLPSMPGIRKGSPFSAVVITYRHVAGCNAFGKPGSTFRSYTCTTMSVLDLQNGKWLGIYQF